MIYKESTECSSKITRRFDSGLAFSDRRWPCFYVCVCVRSGVRVVSAGYCHPTHSLLMINKLRNLMLSLREPEPHS